MTKRNGGAEEPETISLGAQALFRKVMAQDQGIFIAIGPDGRTGAAFTTPDMGYAGPGCRELVL